jgi:SAM-dependent methyltransferase
MDNLYLNKIYKNNGNAAVLNQVPAQAKRILDIGCGAGDNVAILKSSENFIVGVTISEEEAQIARNFCDKVIVGNIENDLELDCGYNFDVIIFSHVCEHLIQPKKILKLLSSRLASNGIIIIAVPNMAYYKNRLRILLGNWQFEDTGPFDRTHLHFYSYETVNELIPDSFSIINKIPGDLSIPLWFFRKLFKQKENLLDRFFGRKFPNLFSQQVILTIRAAK